MTPGPRTVPKCHRPAVGIFQMHVSRLERGALNKLKFSRQMRIFLITPRLVFAPPLYNHLVFVYIIRGEEAMSWIREEDVPKSNVIKVMSTLPSAMEAVGTLSRAVTFGSYQSAGRGHRHDRDSL